MWATTWVPTELEIIAANTHKTYRLGFGLFVVLCGAVIILRLANGGDRLRQEPERSSRCMPGYLMQLVKTRREKTTANNNELALAA